MQSTERAQPSQSKKVFVLGALGAGKSTVLNILSHNGLTEQQQTFEASNSLKGFTQRFNYDFIPLPNGELIQLIDSPGLADRNMLIDVWIRLYNSQIAQLEIDLVVVVIEYAERPSTKEFQVFAVINQALATIKAENLVILFNKCPEVTEPKDAKDFYVECCQQIKEGESKFPILSKQNFLVLNRVGKIKKSLQGKELQQAQQTVNKLLSKQVCDFVYPIIDRVQRKVLAQLADRKKLATSFMDPQTIKEIEEQHEKFNEQRVLYEDQIKQQNQQMEEFKKIMAEKEKEQQKVLNEMKISQQQQSEAHKQDLKDHEQKSAAVIAQLKQQQQCALQQMQNDFNNKLNQINRDTKSKIPEIISSVVEGLKVVSEGVNRFRKHFK